MMLPSPYAEQAIILPEQQSDHSHPYQAVSQIPQFLEHFPGFVANWAERLNQHNLSPIIISDYKHLDILLFRITERGGQ